MNQKLKTDTGFTLVELLVVIAVISILVLIVVITIDPQRRTHEAGDRAAQSNVRLVASVIEACLARNASSNTNGARECDNNPLGEFTQAVNGGPWIRELPGGIVINAAAGPALPITVCSAFGNGHRARYTTTTGQIEHEEVATC